MKDIEEKDAPEVPGGYAPGDGGCIPPAVGYPQNPIGPSEPVGPVPVFSLK